MMRNQRGSAAVQIVWVVAGMVVIVAAFMLVKNSRPGAPVTFSTPYQAVLLTNGQIYFGKLEGYGTPRALLTDVYFIVAENNPDTKQSTKKLIKLGKLEVHEPDRMYLNPSQILYVEPVGEKSQVAQLIAQQK